MNQTATELNAIIDRHFATLQSIPEDVFAHKPSPAKWSKKEIIGHLVDSAQSNIRRFIVTQYEDQPLVKYNQDKWVLASAYQQWDSLDLVRLWYLLNKQVCAILTNMTGEMLQRKCMTEELHSIEWLAADYVKHLLHHLYAVLELEPVAYR